jgi:phosphoribosylformylglycinamidine synthase
MSFTKNIGATVTFPSALPAQAFAFGEDQGRYLLVAPAEHAQNILEEALVAKVPALMLGKTGGDAMNVEGLMSEKIESLRKVNESWLPDYMAG